MMDWLISPGNDDLRIGINVPFLVSYVSQVKPVVGFNVFRELILGQEVGVEVISVISKLIGEAVRLKMTKLRQIENFIQTHEPSPTHTIVKVDGQDIVFHSGQVTHI